MFAHEHHGEQLDAPPGIARRKRLRKLGFWLPATVWPYLGLVGGTFILNGPELGTVAKLWWLAPAAIALYLVALALTIAAMTRRRRRTRLHEHDLAVLADRMRAAIAAGGDALFDELRPRMTRLRDVQRACAKNLSPAQCDAVRTELVLLHAHFALTRQLRRTYATRRRADTLFTLGWLGDEQSVPVLANALSGHDPDLAYVAGQALAEYESRAACHALVTALHRGVLPRPLVATLLESSRYSGAPELVAAAAGDSDAGARSWVAFLLGRCADPRAREWLAPLAADTKSEVRASAAEAYGSFPDPVVLATLLRDKDWRVRANAAKATGNAGLSALVPNLTELMSDGTWWVRQNATIALKQLGPAAVEQLRRLLEADDRFVRNKAAEILIEIGYISTQIAALSGSPEQVAAARHVLGAVARAEARHVLEGAVETADPATRASLVSLLDEVGHAGADVGLAA